ncbi:4Fe-4S dicluster domain-containing protein [bacterium]|nr:4Fe-4S dicluster domain-containing protein [bacterium]
MTPEDIKNKGIVGAGGAGFPAHVKLKSRPEILIMNAAECEPLLHKDKELLLRHMDEVLEGFRIAIEMTGAKRGIIGIKEKHQTLIQSLIRHVRNPVEIVPIGDFYPAGDEITLIWAVTGRVVQPGQLPISAGCLVQNVETLYNMAAPGPVTHKILTVAGEIERPLTLRIPLGTAFSDVMSLFRTTHRDVRLRSGGLMMGKMENDWSSVIDKTTGGLIVLPADHVCVVTAERYATPELTDRTAKASCDQCSFCTELCPRYLLGHPVRPETAMRNRMFTRPDMDLLHTGNAFCCECNLCTLYSCPEGLDPRGAAVIEKKLSRNRPAWEGLPVSPHPMMPYRKVPMHKLKQRLDVLRYTDEGPLSDIRMEPGSVTIPLKQHIGKPARCTVQEGALVRTGDCIAEADGDMSVPVHASIDGRVAGISDTFIVIQRQS